MELPNGIVFQILVRDLSASELSRSGLPKLCVMKVLFFLNLWRTDIFVLCSAQWDKFTNRGDWVLQQCQMVQKVSNPFLSLSLLLSSSTGNKQFASSHWCFESHWISRLGKVLSSQVLMRWAFREWLSPGWYECTLKFKYYCIQINLDIVIALNHKLREPNSNYNSL